MAKKIVTMTLELDTPDGVDEMDGEALATRLQDLLMGQHGDALALGAGHTLSALTLFMAPIAVVLNVSGGVLQGGTSQIPLELITVDYDEDADRLVPQADGSEAAACAGSQMAEVDDEWVTEVRASLDDDEFLIDAATA